MASPLLAFTEGLPRTGLTQGKLDARRRSLIGLGGARDHVGEVVLRRPKTFDLDRTIFKTLTGRLERLSITDRLAVELFWSDAALERIEGSFARVERAPPLNGSIIQFMENECNFSTEHADGSFMDHLQFCYEYSNTYYKGHSPRVMMLHSIMGVGTNCFPMAPEKEPILRALVNEKEMVQIEAFPGVLRLILHGVFLDEVCDASAARLDSLQGLKLHRVIDNKEISLTAEEVWEALNYQLVHLLDFLPVHNWKLREDDNFLVTLIALHSMLQRAGKLEATVNFEWTPRIDFDGSSEPALTLGALIQKVVPSSLRKTLGRKVVARFSDAIGHSLDYQILWPTSKI